MHFVHRVTFAAAAFALALLGPRAHAVRVEFEVVHNGARVRGAEVCFFRAGERDHPVDRFLSADDVRCLSADDVLELPVGRWGHFVRHTDRALVEAQPTVAINNQPEYEQAGYKRLVSEVTPAATLDLSALRASLEGGTVLGVYAANEGTAFFPALFPVARNATRTLVPANTAVVVLAVRDGAITRVSEPAKLAAGSTHRAEWMRERPVTNWLLFTDEARNPNVPWKQLSAPDVTLLSEGREHKPALPMRGGYGGDGSLLLFRGVGGADWTMRVDGDVWQRDEVRNESQPLRTAPGAALRIRWTVVPLAPEPDDACAAAKQKPRLGSKATRRGVHLLSCPSLQPGLSPNAVDRRSCREMQPSAIDDRRREARFRAVPPGVYFAEVTEPGHAPARSVVQLSWGRVTDAGLDLRPFHVFGRLTRDGKPLAARLQFATGETVADGDGRYDAMLLRPPGTLPVNVIDCATGDSIATHVPQQSILENAPYDIELVANVLRIRAVDASTGAAITGATLETVAKAKGGDEWIGFAERVENVPTEVDIVACAKADGYRTTCSEPFLMGETRERTVTLSLRSQAQFRGRVRAPAQIDRGSITFMAPDGRQIESLDVGPDGTFVATRTHSSPGYAVFSAANFPLAVMPLGHDASLELSLPAGPVMSFEIIIGPNSARSDAVLGLFIGGRYVPDGELSRHQQWRGLQTTLFGKGPLHVPHVVVNGPIVVALGPAPKDVATGGLDELFVRRELRAGWPAKSPDAAGRVMFD